MTATSRPIATTRSRSGDAQVVGALLILGGVFWLLQRSGLLELNWRTVISVLLVVLGVGMVVTARRGSGGLLIFVGAVMTLVLVSTSSIDVGVLSEGIGQRVAFPTTVEAAERADSLGIGELRVDLRNLELEEGTTELKYTMGIGEMNITLPDADDVAVRVRASMQGGELDVLGQNRNGGKLSVRTEDPTYDVAPKKLDIVITMGFGNVQVGRAPF